MECRYYLNWLGRLLLLLWETPYVVVSLIVLVMMRAVGRELLRVIHSIGALFKAPSALCSIYPLDG